MSHLALALICPRPLFSHRLSSDDDDIASGASGQCFWASSVARRYPRYPGQNFLCCLIDETLSVSSQWDPRLHFVSTRTVATKTWLVNITWTTTRMHPVPKAWSLYRDYSPGGSSHTDTSYLALEPKTQARTSENVHCSWIHNLFFFCNQTSHNKCNFPDTITPPLLLSPRLTLAQEEPFLGAEENQRVSKLRYFTAQRVS